MKNFRHKKGAFARVMAQVVFDVNLYWIEQGLNKLESKAMLKHEIYIDTCFNNGMSYNVFA